MHQTWLNTSRAKKKSTTLSKYALIYESVLYYIFISCAVRLCRQDKIKHFLWVSIGLDSCLCHFVVLQFPMESLQTSIALTLQQKEH